VAEETDSSIADVISPENEDVRFAVPYLVTIDLFLLFLIDLIVGCG
jgi:hypothetical protein